MHIQQTLLLIKPDAVERGLIGQIIGRFEAAGLRIVGLKFLVADVDDMRAHYGDWVERYTERLGRKMAESTYQAIVGFMTSGPLVALVWEGVEAVAVVRKIVGSTYPNEALPGTIRGDLSHVSQDFANSEGVSIKNLAHASGSVAEAKAEIAAWFKTTELHDYQTVNQKHTYK